MYSYECLKCLQDGRLSVLPPQKATLAVGAARSMRLSRKRMALEGLSTSFMTYSVIFGKLLNFSKF